MYEAKYCLLGNILLEPGVQYLISYLFIVCKNPQVFGWFSKVSIEIVGCPKFMNLILSCYETLTVSAGSLMCVLCLTEMLHYRTLLRYQTKHVWCVEHHSPPKEFEKTPWCTFNFFPNLTVVSSLYRHRQPLDVFDEWF